MYDRKLPMGHIAQLLYFLTFSHPGQNECADIHSSYSNNHGIINQINMYGRKLPMGHIAQLLNFLTFLHPRHTLAFVTPTP